jgi:hypothetical protein
MYDFASEKEYQGYIRCCKKLKLGSRIEVFMNTDNCIERHSTNDRITVDVIGINKNNSDEIFFGSKDKQATMWQGALIQQGYPNFNFVININDYNYFWICSSVNRLSDAKIARIVKY